MSHFGRRRRRARRRFGQELAGRLAALHAAAPPEARDHTNGNSAVNGNGAMNGGNGVNGNGAATVARVVETATARVLPFEISTEEVSPPAPPVSAANAVPLAEAPAPDPVQIDPAPAAPEASVPVETPGPRPAAEDAVPVEPAADEVLFRAAREANANGDIPRAMGLYRELLSLNPRHVRARNNLALLLEQQGEHEDALDQLDQCLACEPGNPQVLVNRGAVLGSLARYREAERDLRTVLQAEPENAEAHFNLGLVISRRGLWGQAIAYLRRSIELEPGRPMAHYYLGEALNKVDDLHGALQAYQRAADLRPTAKVLCGLGVIYDRLNRPEEAAQMYRRSRDLAAR